MAQDDRRGTFNLKAVVRETGVNPDSLRAWERRYRMPSPDRTPGGHRLYSARDIDCLRWLVARQAEGMTISRAVDLWRGLEADGQDPLQSTAYPVPQPSGSGERPAIGESLADLRHAWIAACEALDERKAEWVWQQALALYPSETVCLEVLSEGLAQLGLRWYLGEVSVQQEHFASEMAHRRVEALLMATAPPTGRSPAVVACPPGEQHTFAPLLLTWLLRRRGHPVTYLGADVPREQMDGVLTSVKPQVVILSAQRLVTAASLRGMASDLAGHSVRVGYGGRIFVDLPQLAERISGVYLGDSLDGAVAAAEALFASPRAYPKAGPPPATSQRALAVFRSRRALMDAQAWTASGGLAPDAPPAEFRTSLGDAIQAALEFGDLSIAERELRWVEGLIANHRPAGGGLTAYLEAYQRAARQHLNDAGRPILEWLDHALDISTGTGRTEA